MGAREGPPEGRAHVRRLEHGDLAAALELQARSYPAHLVESEAAFASRLEVATPYCLAAMVGGGLAGYLLAHGWPAGSPPAVGEMLAGGDPAEVLYIHDLAVDRAWRGLDIGQRLVRHAVALAVADGLRSAELIAVEGAAPFWRRLGFTGQPPPPALAAQIATYGAQAQWMVRALP